MNERRIMKGRLAELEEQAKRLDIKMRSTCERIGVLVNPLIYNLDAMPIAEADSLMDDLVMQQAELLNTNSRINELKDNLYG